MSRISKYLEEKKIEKNNLKELDKRYRDAKLGIGNFVSLLGGQMHKEGLKLLDNLEKLYQTSVKSK
jgi:hypothetical protein